MGHFHDHMLSASIGTNNEQTPAVGKTSKNIVPGDLQQVSVLIRHIETFADEIKGAVVYHIFKLNQIIMKGAQGIAEHLVCQGHIIAQEGGKNVAPVYQRISKIRDYAIVAKTIVLNIHPIWTVIIVSLISDAF